MKIYNLLIISLALIAPLHLYSMILDSSILSEAASDTSCDHIQRLLIHSMGAVLQDNDGRTLLHYAAMKGNVPATELLIKRGYNVNAKVQDDPEEGNHTQRQPLHYAAELEDPTLAKLLIDNHALLHTPDGDGLFPIDIAAECGREALVKLFLDECFFVNYADKDGTTVLHWACNTGHPKVIALLLARGADVNAITRGAHDDCAGTPLHRLIDSCMNMDSIQLLLEAGANVNLKSPWGDSILDYALAKHDDDPNKALLINMLVGYGAEVTDENYEKSLTTTKALVLRRRLVCAKSFKEVTPLIPNGLYITPLLKQLIDTKRQVLFSAIERDDEPVVRQMLKDGFSLKTCDKDGNTLLHKACSYNSLKTLELLMFLGAHVYLDTPNKQGETPMYLIVKNGNLDLLYPIRWENGKSEQPLDNKPDNKRKHEDS